MRRERKATVRLNIYLPGREMRRRVKAAAAKQDVSVSEYCVRAIESQLARDGEVTSEEGRSASLAAAVRRARHFGATVLGGKVYSVSSADLIHEAREERELHRGSRRR